MPAALTLAAFLTLAATCGQGVAPQTLAHLAAGESAFNTLAMNVNGAGGGTVRGIATKAQAIAKARSLITQGKDFDAGVAQINRRNWQWLGLTVETVFDPCENIRAQSMLLQSYSRYNTGSPQRGFDNGYVQKIIANSAIMQRHENATVLPEAYPDCPGKPPRWDAWGGAKHAARCSALEREEKAE